jgi:D-serine deaminase-like pyridoxal phosphate-dependent protein
MISGDILKATISREFGTPSVVIDLNVVENNIKAQQSLCDSAGKNNRPHIKTHKSIELAKMQIAAGAAGITCQKLGEAEVMAKAGIKDILISYNILGEEKTSRLGRLMQDANVIVSADNTAVVSGLQNAARIGGRNLEVLVEVDTGRKRSGVENIQEAIALAKKISESEGLTFKGLLLYPPEKKMAETQIILSDILKGLRTEGLEASLVSTGGTPNLFDLNSIPDATEHRAGNFIFGDLKLIQAGYGSVSSCALRVYATVVSRAAENRGVIDAGSKTLTSDLCPGAEGYGYIVEHPEAKISQLAEEHGFLNLIHCNQRPNVEDVVRVIPNHSCVVVNMVNNLIAVRGNEIIGEIPVSARGLIR